jgi:Domain of unknown function (DUF4383)
MDEDGIPIPTDRARLMMTVCRFVSGLLVLLGIVAVLRTKGQGGTWALTVFTVHPLTGVVWLVLGVVGVAMSISIDRARRYLTGAGVLLVAWAVLCLLLDGQPSDFFVRDADLIAFNGVVGLLALTAALTDVPARLVGAVD